MQLLYGTPLHKSCNCIFFNSTARSVRIGARKRTIAAWDTDDGPEKLLMTSWVQTGENYVKQSRTLKEKDKRSKEVYNDSKKMFALAMSTIPTERSTDDIIKLLGTIEKKD